MSCGFSLFENKNQPFKGKPRSYFPGSSDPAALCRLDQSLSAWQDENRGGATLSAGGPCCLYGPMLIKSSMAVFALLHYTGWWSKCLCFSSLNAAGRDIRCPCGAVWWAGQVGLFCWEVKFFFFFYIQHHNSFYIFMQKMSQCVDGCQDISVWLMRSNRVVAKALLWCSGWLLLFPK